MDLGERREGRLHIAVVGYLPGGALRAEPVLANQPPVLERLLYRSRKSAGVVFITASATVAGGRAVDAVNTRRLSRDHASKASRPGNHGSRVLRRRERGASKRVHALSHEQSGGSRIRTLSSAYRH